MSSESKATRSNPLQMELAVGSSANTLLLFRDSVYNNALNDLEVHLKKYRIEQHVFDRCLMDGLQLVERRDQELSQVAPTLQLLLQFGAQWKVDTFLDHRTTPYHLICKSSGDHHELLDLMFISSGRELIDTEDSSGFTALLYAVKNANINCVRSLIVNGAGLHVPNTHCLFIEIIDFLTCSYISQSINTDIFELLVDSSEANKYLSESINFAISTHNVKCVIKLFKKTFHFNTSHKKNCYDWARAAHMGSVDLLKCMLNHGIDKDCTDKEGRSLLTWTIRSGKPEAVRYLLDIGVSVPKYDPQSKSKFKLCKKCGKNTLLLDSNFFSKWVDDPCARAIRMDIPEIVEMLVEHGGLSCISFNALARAVRSSSANVVEYLLSKYSYPLNIEYIWTDSCERECGTLTKAYSFPRFIRVAKSLLSHGADVNKQVCKYNGLSPLNTALCRGHEEFIALYIRNGVDINFKSHALPIEVAVVRDRLFATEMLLVSGCSCGMFSLGNYLEHKDDMKSDIEDLLRKWNVHENNVIPLKMQCRRMILNHLSPQADKKITKLPLPPGVITYLRIPELDDILDVCKTSDRNHYRHCQAESYAKCSRFE